jgi:hypothetical protein
LDEVWVDGGDQFPFRQSSPLPSSMGCQIKHRNKKSDADASSDKSAPWKWRQELKPRIHAG